MFEDLEFRKLLHISYQLIFQTTTTKVSWQEWRWQQWRSKQ